jgi:hypothetical protein
MSGNNIEEVRMLEWKLQLNGVQILTFAGVTIAVWYASPTNWFLLPLTGLIVRFVQTFLFARKLRRLLNS